MQQALHARTGDLLGAACAGNHLVGLRRRGAGVLAWLRAWLRARLAGPVMAEELSPALRSDIGIEDTPLSGPILEVDGATMRRLMALR